MSEKPAAPVIPRDAASLLVLRGVGPSTEILMARRGAGHRFMPNMLVFPGGSVDAADFAAPAASELRPEVLARLCRSASPPLARALAIAAARELTEEVGLSLGAPPELAPLAYLCRAITPPGRAIRFDARFLLVQATHVSGTLAASAELEAPGWYTVEAALLQDLALATREVLRQLTRWLEVSDHAGPVPVLIDRVWKTE